MSDKRTVSTDALETLGTIIDANQKRDAIHLAVIPVEAGEQMCPGEPARLVDGKAIGADARDGHGSLGIVDPFLTSNVAKGAHFWLVIYPRVITSLRHVWTHPQLPDEAGVSSVGSLTKEAAVAWLTSYAERMGADYEQLIFALENYGTFDGQPDYYNHNPQACRIYYEVATGKPWVIGDQDYFSCSC